MKYIVTLLVLLFASSAYASISCVCDYPGSPGTITGFDCSVGENVNLSIMIEEVPGIGEVAEGRAYKIIEGVYVPAKNLEINISLNSEDITQITTDDTGAFSFSISSPGDYEFCGGDATLNFTVESVLPEQPDPLPETEPEPEAIEPESELDLDPIDTQNISDTKIPEPYQYPKDDPTPIILIIVGVVLVALGALMLKSKKAKK